MLTHITTRDRCIGQGNPSGVCPGDTHKNITGRYSRPDSLNSGLSRKSDISHIRQIRHKGPSVQISTAEENLPIIIKISTPATRSACNQKSCISKLFPLSPTSTTPNFVKRPLSPLFEQIKLTRYQATKTIDTPCLSIKEVSDTSLDIQRRTNNRKRRQSFRGELQESGTQTLRLQSIFHTFQLITKEPGINFTSRNKRSTTLVKRQRDTSNSRISYGCPCRNQDRASRNDRRSCPDPFLCDCTPCRVQLPRNRSQVDWRGPRDAAVPVFRIRGRCPSVDNPKQPTQRDPGPVHFFTFRSRS